MIESSGSSNSAGLVVRSDNLVPAEETVPPSDLLHPSLQAGLPVFVGRVREEEQATS